MSTSPEETDALAQVISLLANIVEDSGSGLEVEGFDATTLSVSWPLSTSHPQPPGLPPVMHLSIASTRNET